jgi:hypothetical protein
MRAGEKNSSTLRSCLSSRQTLWKVIARFGFLAFEIISARERERERERERKGERWNEIKEVFLWFHHLWWRRNEILSFHRSGEYL